MATIKKTTCTKLVLDYLIRLDDFATRLMVIKGAGVRPDQATATLHDLKKRHAIEAMEVDGTLWFYATPEYDNRTRTFDEIKDGITRNRKPKRRVVTEPAPKP